MRQFITAILGLIFLATQCAVAGSAALSGDAEPGIPVVGEGKTIPIKTSFGEFKVWTKQVGDNPDIKVLLLHGGPGGTHEAFEVFARHFPDAGIEFFYYDQLGSWFSDQPDDPRLLEIDRFVDEVEQVRKALKLGPDNFYLLGHSWGGILAIEYALVHQHQLKGLIISNMMASIPAYNKYASEVLMADMDPEVLAELKAIEANKDYSNPRYMELLMENHYTDHVLRMPADEWPDAVNRFLAHINPEVYIPMQGPSELGASGRLANWDRTADLHKITVPTLVIGATFDTMDPGHMEWMSTEVKHGQFLLCPYGSHFDMWDDQTTYFKGLLDFLGDVNREK